MLSKILINILIFAYIFPNIIAARDVVNHKSKTCDDDKIVGGEKVSITDFPYQVYISASVGEGFKSPCGGSIIGKNYVLTAAHCLFNRLSKVDIRAGSDCSNSGGQVYSSSDFIIHPKYNTTSADYDVAIVRLGDPMKLDGITSRPIQLSEADVILEPGTNLNVSGWGKTSFTGTASNHLRAVTVPVTISEYCHQGYPGIITPQMFCAGFKQGNKDSCTGDSGGPAVHNSIQVGIVSFGNKCGLPSYPGVYASVPSVRKWIKEVTGI